MTERASSTLDTFVSLEYKANGNPRGEGIRRSRMENRMKKFNLSLLLSILLVAQSYAAISFPVNQNGDRIPNSFTGANKVSSGQLTVSTSWFTLDVGDKIFVHVAKDNLSPLDGETNEVISVEDSLGNTYVKIKEFTNGQNKKLGGVVVAMFLATNEIATSNDTFAVTVHFSTSNVVAKAAVVQRLISDHPLVPVAEAELINDNANPSLMDIEVPDNVEHLWVRSMGLEGAWVNFFKTPAYDDWGTTGTLGGGGASNIAVAYEADIHTGPSNPSDPLAINADCVSILVVFKELVPQ